MARVNLDSKVFTDPRIKKLAKKTSATCFQVIGQLAFVWSQCTENGSDVLKKDYVNVLADDENFSAVMIDCELAEEVDDEHVRVRGARERVEWIVNLRKNAKKGGKAKAKQKAEKKLANGTDDECLKAEKKVPPGTRVLCPITTTITPSITNATTNSVSSHDPSREGEETFDAEIVGEKKTPGSRVWEAYASAYFSRYNVLPVRNAKANSQCSQLVKRLGEEDAVAVVQFYLSHTDQFYLRRSHPLGDCLANAEGLRTQMLTGNKVTGSKAQQQERSSDIWEAAAQISARWEAEEKAKEQAK